MQGKVSSATTTGGGGAWKKSLQRFMAGERPGFFPRKFHVTYGSMGRAKVDEVFELMLCD